MKVDTLRWAHNKLEMADQRILPPALEYLAYDSVDLVAEGVRSMVVRGAPAIGVTLEALRLSASSTLRQTQGERDEFDKGMEVSFIN